MKIALVYPPFENSIKTTLPDFVDESGGFFPPLGIMYIASYLKSMRDTDSILVLDSVSEKMDCRGISSRLADFKADIVGISCWTFSYMDALNTARQIKKSLPKTLVCFGGPHVNIYPLQTLANDCVDFVITHDGEKAFYELIRQLEAGRELQMVSNLYYKENGISKQSAFKYIEKDLDRLPFPDRRLTDIHKYCSIMDNPGLITTMITSRGCPFGCSFCFQQFTGWRPRSAANIISEMKECISLGISNFFIFDETFTVNKQRIMEICREIKNNGLKISWSCRSRVDTIDEEVLDNLKNSGCNRISFGVEAANLEVLRRLNKKITIQRAVDAFKLAKRKGMVTLADFMVGCPEEDLDRTRETLRLARRLDPDYAQFSLFTLFPATGLYQEAIREGVVKGDVWLEYAINPRPDFKPPLWNIYTQQEAQRILIMAYHNFYLRFGYILKQLRRINSLRQVRSYLKIFYRLAKSVFLSKNSGNIKGRPSVETE